MLELTLLHGAGSVGLLAKYSPRRKNNKCFIFKLVEKYWMWPGCYIEVIFINYCPLKPHFFCQHFWFGSGVYLHVVTMCKIVGAWSSVPAVSLRRPALLHCAAW